ncbi:hypothetical protein J7L48_04760 [bacterium]|nr:hypothetical protein [bacterium]
MIDIFHLKGRQTPLSLYKKLFAQYGPQFWWPADSKFEIIIGALLTQNTNWKNVEKAIGNLRKKHLLEPQKILDLDMEKLKELIKPSGFFNQKAERLKLLIEFFEGEGCDNFKKCKIIYHESFRKKLLKVNGIGPETCDSILLYAFNVPIFVIDTYTKRFVKYYHLPANDLKYTTLQDYFHKNLPKDTKLFNEYHALIVRWGKEKQLRIDS